MLDHIDSVWRPGHIIDTPRRTAPPSPAARRARRSASSDCRMICLLYTSAGFLVLIALTSLAFGAAAGVTCSHASCGFAKNLRHDLFYKIQRCV